jgi:hypothetical protein
MGWRSFLGCWFADGLIVRAKGTRLNEGNNHRYTLRREWNRQRLGLVNFIMLNPSTADEVFDDATIRRCIGFAKRWGFSAIVVTNLFAYRATNPADPRDLVRDDGGLHVGVAIGRYNDTWIRTSAAASEMIVLAWGDHGTLIGRDAEVKVTLGNRDLYCIRMTAGGNPAHPVRESYTDAPLIYQRALSAHDQNREPTATSEKSANT